MSTLRRTRVNARLSIDELADKSGVSPEQIRNIETGRSSNPRAATLGKLADALSSKSAHVDPADLDPVLDATEQATV